jgi:hypothetical protein
MSDEFDNEKLDLDQDGDNAVVATLRERNRRLAAQAKDAKAVPDLKRKVALFESGIDFTSPTAQMFRDLYSGDPTPEAITEAARKYGLIEAPAQVEAPDADVAAAQRIAAASNGASIPAAAGPLTADVLNSWSRDRRDAFRNQHPDAYKRIRNGETVSGLTV